MYSNEAKYYEIDGYKAVHACRESRGGGAAIYIKNSIKFKELGKSTIDKQYNWVCVSVDNLKISAIYKPPSYNCNDFLSELEILINLHPKNHVIIGDFNINILDVNSQTTKEYKNLIALNGFKIVNKINLANATRVTATTHTLIDHVISSASVTGRCRVKVADSAISDHRLLYIEIKKKMRDSSQKHTSTKKT